MEQTAEVQPTETQVAAGVQSQSLVPTPEIPLAESRVREIVRQEVKAIKEEEAAKKRPFTFSSRKKS